MAVIGKIRQRSGLLVLLIGASIVGFLIMDATNSQSSVLRSRKDTVGVVNGIKISNSEFSKKLEDNTKNMEEQMRGNPMSDDQRDGLRKTTWDEMVNDIIFNKIYEQLGINVTPDEMTELATGQENAHPYIKQAFSNPQTRQFDPAQVRFFLEHLDNDDPGAEPGTKRKQWLKFEAEMKKSQFQQKYNNLISKGLYVPTWLAEMTYADQTRTVDFKYVGAAYSEVNDADIKVTDDDLKKFIDEHPARYKQDEETRKFQYVTFDIVPSLADTMKAIQTLEEKREEFAKGTKPSDDSVFVKVNSETPFDEAYYEKDKMISPIKDSLFSLKVGSVIGPFLSGDTAKLAKISDRKLISDSVRVRDIKFSFAGINTQDAANVKFMQIDSIYKQIDSLKGDFGAFAMAFSDDAASKIKGGDLGWVKQGEKDKMYNDLLFYRAVKGKYYKVPSQTENAIHIVQVTDEKPTKMGVEVSYFSKQILPSSETVKNIYAKATNFAADNQATAKFKAAAEKLNPKTIPSIQKNDFTVQGLGSARDLIKWLFNAKKGDVSSTYTVGSKLVVAMLEEVHPKGVPDVDAVRERVKFEVIKQKKFDLLAKKFTDAKAGNIDDLASKLGKSVGTAEKASLSNPGVNNSYEPKVVATAMGSAPNKLSQPVEGNSGVYAVQTTAVSELPKLPDYSRMQGQMKMQLQGKSRFASDVEKKLAKVEDNRFDFF